jgi:hypothetical protein
VSQGRHGGHVDHVKDLAEVVHHAQVVKNPDLVLFGKFKHRNSYNKSARQIRIICLNYVLFVVRGLHVGQGRIIARRIGICLYYVLCLNYVFFVVRGLHVSQGRHGGHVDHVKDLAEALALI